MKLRLTFGIAAIVVLAFIGSASAQSWVQINNEVCTGSNPCFPPGMTMLLTDGSVLVHEEQDGGEVHWFKLTPDAFGSYVNATWSQIADIPAGLDYAPLFFGSQVISDGRLTVIGGEYNFDSPVWTTKGAIYDPTANTWTNVPPPTGWQRTGDAQSMNLADGTYMQASCCDQPPKWAYLNPTTLGWTQFQGGGKFDVFDEEGWNLLPNGKILTVDAYVFQYDPNGKNSELYDPTSKTWSSAGSTIVQIWDSHCGNQSQATFEVGPAVLRPDGSLFQTGSNTCGAGHTAVYAGGTWTPGPDFPGTISIADGPASIEPSGKVLMMGSTNEDPPASFFEWDGTNLTPIPPSPNAVNDGSFYGHMLPLPTGQIMFTDWNEVDIFTPSGTYNPAWAPQVLLSSTIVTRGTTNTLHGYRLAGVSQGGAYGDDYQPTTNYALVRLTNQATHHVFYCRTHNPSSYQVQSSALQSTKFDVPAGIETGPSTLEAVTNGIPSAPVTVTVR